MLKEQTRARQRPAPPPKRWRNRWRSRIGSTRTCIVCGRHSPVAAGEIYESHCLVYPSRDAAETHARELDARAEGRDYLGAFPLA